MMMIETLGEKRARMRRQREQATRLIAELTALGYAAGMVRRKGAIVLKCAKRMGEGAVLTWDEHGFTGEIIMDARDYRCTTGSVSEAMDILRWP